jgi:RimJ/RimL family protein N-acetyltransferase
MLDYVYGHDEAVAQFVASLIPHCHRGFGPNAKAIGVIDNEGYLIAGIVYHNWDPEAGIIELSGAALPGTYWLTRETLARMYQYPFHQCGCQMVVQRTPSDDVRLLGILAAYGFSFVTIPRLFGRDRDGVICSLTREAWESNKFNRRLKHHVEPPIEEAA